MEPNKKDRLINTTEPVNKDAGKRLPHERDESPEGARHQKPRSVIRQAAEDVESGLVDTDRRATPGLQKAPEGNRGEDTQAKPLPGTKRD
ncbi:MAG TPA: hypothetical protein VGF27_24205 [Pseudoduganella sp.]